MYVYFILPNNGFYIVYLNDLMEGYIISVCIIIIP